MLNFKMSELLHSDIAIKRNINNMPDVNALNNLLNLIFYCLQPTRNLLKEPMIITSGYRCKKLNDIVGGASNSSHLIGAAADFVIKNSKISHVFEKIKKSNIEFDELINEHDKWIHISFLKNKNRRKILYLK